MDFIEEKEELKQYIPALQEITIMRLIKQVWLVIDSLLSWAWATDLYVTFDEKSRIWLQDIVVYVPFVSFCLAIYC